MFDIILKLITNILEYPKPIHKNKTIDDLLDDIIKRLNYIEIDILEKTLSIIKEYNFSTNKEIQYDVIISINNILESYFRTQILIIFTFEKEWDNIFNKYPKIKDSIEKCKRNFINNLRLDKSQTLKDLRIELIEGEGLDEVYILRSFYINKAFSLFRHHIIYFEGELMQLLRINMDIED